VKSFVNCSELIHNENYFPIQAVPNYVGQSSNSQTIFPTAMEHKFYSLLVSNISKITYRVFERDGIWVDQRTLSLSMMNGGWFHFRVMDCFCKLFSYSQRNQVDNQSFKIFLSNVTTSILMDKNLDHKNYKANFLEIIGIQPDVCGLVHIPCFIDKQWVLVVVNFLERKFDILSSEYGADRTMHVTNTVVYNFRVFFILAFPSFQQFNIRDFEVHYINVPKQQNKTDSGIFVTCFMETFDGRNIAPFTSAVIQGLREKKLFHLIFSKENKAKKPLIVSNFQRQYNL